MASNMGWPSKGGRRRRCVRREGKVAQRRAKLTRVIDRAVACENESGNLVQSGGRPEGAELLPEDEIGGEKVGNTCDEMRVRLRQIVPGHANSAPLEGSKRATWTMYGREKLMWTPH